MASHPPEGFDARVSMLPDNTSANIAVMRGGARKVDPILQHGGVRTPEEDAILAQYEMGEGGAIANKFSEETKSEFLRQIANGRCNIGTGDTVILRNDCRAVVEVIQALIQEDFERRKCRKNNEQELSEEERRARNTQEAAAEVAALSGTPSIPSNPNPTIETISSIPTGRGGRAAGPLSALSSALRTSVARRARPTVGRPGSVAAAAAAAAARPTVGRPGSVAAAAAARQTPATVLAGRSNPITSIRRALPRINPFRRTARGGGIRARKNRKTNATRKNRKSRRNSRANRDSRDSRR